MICILLGIILLVEVYKWKFLFNYKLITSKNHLLLFYNTGDCEDKKVPCFKF